MANMEENVSAFDIGSYDTLGLATKYWFRALVVLVILICVVTRIVTGVLGFLRRPASDKPRSARELPYWIPYIGHTLSLVFSRRRLLESASKNVNEPVLAVKVCGRTCNVITSPFMAENLVEQHSSISPGSFTNLFMENFFGSPKKMRKFNGTDLRKYGVNSEAQIDAASSDLVRQLKRNVPNMLSFSSSVVDQNPWERMNKISVAHNEDGTSTCKADLYAFIRSFAGVILTTELMGSSFMEAAPMILEYLWTFNSKFNAIALGIPRWVPFPGLPRAYAARRLLLEAMGIFNTAFTMVEDGRDPGFDWRDLEDVSELMKARLRSLNDAGISAESAAPENLSILWAINTKASPLVFWNFLFILEDPVLHAQIMEEITPFCQALRPKPEETGFQIQEAPRLSLDLGGLLESCPLFRASYYETLRLQSSTFTCGELTADLTIAESEQDTTSDRKSYSYRFRAGEFIAIPHAIHYKDARYYPEPEIFNPKRFLSEASDAAPETEDEALLEKHDNSSSGPKVATRIETAWPFCQQEKEFRGAGLTERTVLAFTAALLVMWDVKPADGKPWRIPKRNARFAVYEPASDIRVTIKLKV